MPSIACPACAGLSGSPPGEYTVACTGLTMLPAAAPPLELVEGPLRPSWSLSRPPTSPNIRVSTEAKTSSATSEHRRAGANPDRDGAAPADARVRLVNARVCGPGPDGGGVGGGAFVADGGEQLGTVGHHRRLL